MDTKLIFDVGMHLGEDTGYFLHRGYRVIAIDADERVIERGRETFSREVASGQLVLLHCAVTEMDGEAEFHLSKRTGWSSLDAEIPSRQGGFQGTTVVAARRLSSLLREYGVPLYCKIDVEGHDLVCLRSLAEAEERPRYVSAETECLGEDSVQTEEGSLQTLNQLRDLGYEHFKLVDQNTLMVLHPDEPFYTRQPPAWARVMRRLGVRTRNPAGENRARLAERFEWSFAPSASGPFGEDLQGEWLGYEAARRALLRHRREYFTNPLAPNWSFWCDWHAVAELPSRMRRSLRNALLPIAAAWEGGGAALFECLALL